MSETLFRTILSMVVNSVGYTAIVSFAINSSFNNSTRSLVPMVPNSNSVNTTRSFSDSSSENKKVVINGTTYNVAAIYENPIEDRERINKEIKGKSGVYAWVNKINGKAYVGSSINLDDRVSDYFKPSYLNKYSKIVIARAIIKYGLLNFSLVILEFTDRNKDSH